MSPGFDVPASPVSPCTSTHQTFEEKSTPKTTSMQQNPTKPFDWSGSWLWEISATVLSIISIALLLGFLAYLNNSAYNNWQYTVSPNTVVSIISTIAKTALLVPVSACIGQLKWHKSKSPSPLYQMHVLDQASRGPWGSVEVLWTMAPGLATFGALLTILSLAMDPFAQQIISIRSRDVRATNETAYLQKAERLFTTDDGSPGSTQFAILNGLYQTNTPLRPNCDTGFCTYPGFVTLGFCSRCEDVTAQSNQTCRTYRNESSSGQFEDVFKGFLKIQNNCTYTAPGGIQFNAGHPNNIAGDSERVEIEHDNGMNASKTIEAVFGVDVPVITSLRVRYDGPLVYTHANLSVWEKKPNLTQCAIYLCERQYSNSDSRRFPKLLKTQPLSPVSYDESLSRAGSKYLVPPYGFTKLAPNNSYMLMDYLPVWQIGVDISKVLRTDTDTSSVLGTDFLASDDRLSEKMASLATSLTDILRNTNKSIIKVPGQAFRNEGYIHIRWPYVILPIAIVVLSTALLVATAQSGRSLQPVLWKNSVLPLIVGRFETGSGDDLSDLKHVDELERKSKKIKISVEDREGILFES